MSVDERLGLCVDAVVALDDCSFYVRGWLRRRQTEISRLTAVTPEGGRLEVLGRAVKYPRRDVEAHFADPFSVCEGFSCFLETSLPIRKGTDWRFELEDRDGDSIEERARVLVRDPDLAQSEILDDLSHAAPYEDSLIRHHAFPALRILAEAHRSSSTLDRIVQFGVPPDDPTVSIVVPLYGQELLLVELQLASFVDDPDIAGADLIYVPASPDIGSELLEHCAELHEIYPQPFRVVIPQRRSGFVSAHNVGASLSRGRLLLLLSSDVVPVESGWLSAMVRFYDATPNIGALGPKLLYEDDSIHHAGIYFDRSAGKATWETRRYFAGMHRTLPAANHARPIPAVTGACLVISRERFFDYDGLLGLYVEGDLADSDLCLRLRRDGYDNWYLPDAELYYLKDPSYDGGARQPNSRYNAWLHTELRGDVMTEVMDRFGSPSSAMASSAEGSRKQPQ
jgi:GT2 family glycosyltransferase